MKGAGADRWTAAEEKRAERLRRTCPNILRDDLELYFRELRVPGKRLDESTAGWLEWYFRKCQKIPDLWPRFRGELCHLTTEANWTGIQDSGHILPSGSGHLNWHGRVPGSISLALQKRAVALFDLAGIESKHFRTGVQALGAIRALIAPEGAAIWLTIDRTQLPLTLQRFDGTPAGAFAIPHWETHHCGPIPLAAVSEVHKAAEDSSGLIGFIKQPWPR